MRGTVRKWGNSAAVRIPAAVLEASGLQLDSPVDVREDGGRVVIERASEGAASLRALLARITPDNLHAEADFGPAMGKEAF